jgi:hypothetical protein
MNGTCTLALASAIVTVLTAPAATLDRMAQAIENRSDKGEVRPGTAEARVVRRRDVAQPGCHRRPLLTA